MMTTMEKISLIIYWGVLAFSPLAFGASEAWSLGIMGGGILVALSLFILGRRGEKRDILAVPGLLPLFLFLVYILVQLVPLPPAFLKVISPAAHRLYLAATGVIAPGAWVPLTVCKKATVMEFFRFLSYVGIYFLTVQFLGHKDLLKKTIRMLAGYAAFLSLLAILQHFTFADHMLWFRDPLSGSPFGTYVNRNHYAGFMGMIFPIIVGLFLYMKPTVSYLSFRERIVELFSQDRSNFHVLLGTAAVLMAASVFVSLSRGGIVCLCLSLCALGIVLIIKGNNRRAGLFICALFITILFCVGWFGWDPIFARFNKIRNPAGEITETRLQIWADSRSMVADFPLTGTGFGTFEYIYPAYRSVAGGRSYLHCHNDFIELATDGGLIGVSLVAWFLGVLFFRSFGAFRKRREPYTLYLFAGSFAGLVSMLCHSLVDFNLHIGANGLFFFFLAGLMVSAAHTRLRAPRQKTRLRAVSMPCPRVLAGCAAAFCALTLVFHTGVWLGDLYFQRVVPITYQDDLNARERSYVVDKLARAARVDPLESLYPFMRADVIHYHTEKKRDAAAHYHRAIELAPSDGGILQEYALFLSDVAHDRAAAEAFFRAGIQYSPMDPDVYREYGFWLLKDARVETARVYIRQAIARAPRRTLSVVEDLRKNGWALADIGHVLPQAVRPNVLLAGYLDREGNQMAAEDAYRKALKYMDHEAKVTAQLFDPIHNYYKKNKRYEEALDVMLQAKRHLPASIPVRLRLADLYEKLDIAYRAKAEYTKVLMWDPDNQTAKRRLEKLG